MDSRTYKDNTTMKKYYKFFFVLTALLFALGGMTSCTDEDILGSAPRLFRPSSTVLTSDGNWILAEWNLSTEAVYYELQLSRDTFATIDRTDTTSGEYFLFSDVNWDQTYQVRIKAIGDTLESEYFVCEEITVADYPTLLQNISDDDIIDNSVIIRWSIGATPYTAIRVYTEADSLVDTVAISSAEYALGYKIIEGLDASTTYKMEAFTDNTYCGKKRVTTLAAQIFENAVDLRSLPDEDADSILTDAWANALPSVSGITTIVLKGGMDYFITMDSLSRSLKFITGYSFLGKATLRMSSACDLVASFDSLLFENVNLKGIEATKTTPTTYGGSYVFNGSRAFTCEKLSMVNCTIKYLRGICRVKTTGCHIKNLVIENCIADSIGGYGVACTDAANASIRNISFTNSTFIRTDVFVKNQKTDTLETVYVDYCTFYNTPYTATSESVPATAGVHYFDFSGRSFNSITMQNCLMGPGRGAAPMGIKFKTLGSTNMSNNYMTSDATWFTTTTTSTSILIDATDAGISSTNLWNNLLTGDLTIVGAFSRSVGDPRWR
jgi:hypothetical protein